MTALHGAYRLEKGSLHHVSLKSEAELEKLTESPGRWKQLTMRNSTRSPLSFGNFKMIEEIDARFSRLEMLSLTEVDLCKLSLKICDITSLKSLELYGNALKELPKEIGQLSLLRSLNLNTNQLEVIPTEIGRLVSLQYLNLTNNPLSNLPREIGNLGNLQTLSADHTHLESVPSEIGNCTALTTLTLGSDAWKSTQVESLKIGIKQMTKLERLDIDWDGIQNLDALFFPSFSCKIFVHGFPQELVSKVRERVCSSKRQHPEILLICSLFYRVHFENFKETLW